MRSTNQTTAQTLLGLFIAGAAMLAATSALHAAGPVGPNLVVNPGAEATPGAGNFSSSITPAGWTTTGPLTAVRYDIGTTADLNAADSTEVQGGTNYFAGGPTAANTSASQTLNVNGLTPQIGGGLRWFRLGGHLGGWSSQSDRSTFAAIFRTGDGTELARTTIGPVLAAERLNEAKLLWRADFGVIPANAITAHLTIQATTAQGAYNDGYADNLAFQLTAEPGDASVDGKVNFDDLLTLSQNYGQTGRTWESGDFSGDAAVGFDDLLLLAQHYGSNGGSNGVVDASRLGAAFAADWAKAQSLVPEPASIAAVAALALSGTGRRRRG